MSASELKPCPFCGSKGLVKRTPCFDGFGTFVAIACSQCGASAREVYFSSGNDCPDTYVTVRQNWNTRSDTAASAIRKAVEDEREACALAIVEPISEIVYDVWYKSKWPVSSHGHQNVYEAAQSAIRARGDKPEVTG